MKTCQGKLARVEGALKGGFYSLAHVPAYQLYPLKKNTQHVLLDTSVIHTIIMSKNDQNSQKISTDYTKNVGISISE